MNEYLKKFVISCFVLCILIGIGIYFVNNTIQKCHIRCENYALTKSYEVLKYEVNARQCSCQFVDSENNLKYYKFKDK
jgi:hypothetical protein